MTVRGRRMKYKKVLAAVMAVSVVLSAGMFTGCGSAKSQQQQSLKVTTFRPFKSDTPIMREYTGSITALQEVPVRAKVSGTIVEKYITGGQHVEAGQALYRIDTRSYWLRHRHLQHRHLLLMKMRKRIWPVMNSWLAAVLFQNRHMTDRNHLQKPIGLFMKRLRRRYRLLPII